MKCLWLSMLIHANTLKIIIWTKLQKYITNIGTLKWKEEKKKSDHEFLESKIDFLQQSSIWTNYVHRVQYLYCTGQPSGNVDRFLQFHSFLLTERDFFFKTLLLLLFIAHYFAFSLSFTLNEKYKQRRHTFWRFVSLRK